MDRSTELLGHTHSPAGGWGGINDVQGLSLAALRAFWLNMFLEEGFINVRNRLHMVRVVRGIDSEATGEHPVRLK